MRSETVELWGETVEFGGETVELSPPWTVRLSSCGVRLSSCGVRLSSSGVRLSSLSFPSGCVSAVRLGGERSESTQSHRRHTPRGKTMLGSLSPELDRSHACISTVSLRELDRSHRPGGRQLDSLSPDLESLSPQLDSLTPQARHISPSRGETVELYLERICLRSRF